LITASGVVCQRGCGSSGPPNAGWDGGGCL